MVDDYSGECLALVADTSLSGHRVARKLDAVIARRGILPRLIFAPQTEPFEAGVFRYGFPAGRGAESHESIEVFGRAEGVHHQAGRRGYAGGRNLPEGRDQPGHLLQPEEEVCRSVANIALVAEA